MISVSTVFVAKVARLPCVSFAFLARHCLCLPCRHPGLVTVEAVLMDDAAAVAKWVPAADIICTTTNSNTPLFDSAAGVVSSALCRPFFRCCWCFCMNGCFTRGVQYVLSDVAHVSLRGANFRASMPGCPQAVKDGCHINAIGPCPPANPLQPIRPIL